jgi:hypothetical protein
MESLRKKQIILPFLVIIFSVLVVFNIFSSTVAKKEQKVSVRPTFTQETTNFSYTGKKGIDALTLLKQQTTVGQEPSGLVSSIDGRKADSKKKEFWAFYVNGQMANVGPADYVTKDTDNIEWKLENY